MTSLPTIVQFIGTRDGGPVRDPGDESYCPHCGAKGRYVHTFRCDDGNIYGAMSGCIKLFPVSEIASEHMRLDERLRKLRGAYGKDAHLNAFEQKMMDAIEAVYDGSLSAADAIRTIKHVKADLAGWRTKKYGRKF